MLPFLQEKIGALIGIVRFARKITGLCNKFQFNRDRNFARGMAKKVWTRALEQRPFKYEEIRHFKNFFLLGKHYRQLDLSKIRNYKSLLSFEMVRFYIVFLSPEPLFFSKHTVLWWYILIYRRELFR